MYDLNDAAPQMGPMGELIPDGTFAKLRMTIRPGGVNGGSALDVGLLKASASSDAKMLDCEFTVVEGPYARRKLWQHYTVSGGKLNKDGMSIAWGISKSAFRAMIDSALGLDSKDESADAKAKRRLDGLKHLDGITFVARIMIEPSTSAQYQDQNRIANVVLVSEPQYAVVMRGETPPADPIGAKPRKATASAANGAQGSMAPAWAANGAATAATKEKSGGSPAAPVPAWLNG